MKKLFFTIALLIVSAGATMAQSFGFGPRVGMNFSTIVGVLDGIDTDWRVGFVGGLFADYRFCEAVALELDVLYSQEGVREIYLKEYIAEGFKLNTDYMKIPLLAKFYPIENMSLQVGPQLAINVRDKVSGNIISSVAMSSAINDINKCNCDIVVGAGYEFGAFLLDLRYSLSLTQTFEKVNNVRFTKGRNSTLQLTAGWRF